MFQIMTWEVLTKSQLLRFKAMHGSKICTEDAKKVKFERYKDWNAFIIYLQRLKSDCIEKYEFEPCMFKIW